MSLTIRTVEYFYVRAGHPPDEAYELLGQLAAEGIDLHAFSAVPYGPKHTEFTLFPDDSRKLMAVTTRLGWNITGPQHAVLVQGDDRLGAASDIHKCLRDARVSIYASSGITDGAGRYGYVIYLKEGDHLEAARALERVSAGLSFAPSTHHTASPAT